MQPVPAWGTIPAMLRAQAAEHPDVEVVADGATRLTLAELAGQAGEVARALIAAGIRPGDRVAVWAPNCWQWAVVAFGVWDVGGVIVPLSTRFKGAEAAGILTTTGARLLIVAGEFLGVSYLDLLTAAAADRAGPRTAACRAARAGTGRHARRRRPGTTSSPPAPRSTRPRRSGGPRRWRPTTSPRSWPPPAPPARRRA